MKKLLTVLIALSLVASGFAAEPLADLNTVDFSGEASVTWGIDVDSQQTGFRNETDVELIINLLPGDMSKSTEGSGVWGELVVLVDGDTQIKSDEAGAVPTLQGSAVKVDAAKIHINDLYVGITSGDFDYDGGVVFPNAFNYDGDEDLAGSVNNGNQETGFDQGVVLGYANDMFNVEASVRSNYANAGDPAHIVGFTIVEADAAEPFEDSNGTTIRYFTVDGEVELLQNENAVADRRYYRVVFEQDSDTYWTDQYAVGGYAEFTGVENLKVGIGGSYILSGQDVGTNFNKGDHQIFAGADYVFMLNDTMSLVPAVAYNYGLNNNPLSDEATIANNDLGFGLGFRWGESEDASSLLADFYGDGELVYTADDDDESLLPGVSVWTNLTFMKYNPGWVYEVNTDLDPDTIEYTFNNKTDTYLPLMVNVYSGEIVPGLKAYGLFYANVAPKLQAAIATSAVTVDPDGPEAVPMQFGLAASYDLAVADLTITPKVGALVNYSVQSNKNVNYGELDEDLVVRYTNTTTTFMPEVAVDVAGLIPNTTFSAAWADAAYMSSSMKVGDADPVTSEKSTNGEVTFKCTIAL